MVDNDIASIFAAVAQDIQPDLATVIAEATRQGRRRRARRKLAFTCTTSASAVAVVVAATATAHLIPAKGHGAIPTRPGGHHHPRVIKPKPHHTRPPVPQAHGPGMRSSQMLAVLRPMLPASWVVTWVSPDPTRGELQIDFNDGQGAADILLSVEPSSNFDGDGDYYCPSPPWKDEGKRPAGALPIGCVRHVFADGSTEEAAVSYADAASYYVYLIYEGRPNGVTVTINVGNGTLDGTPHLSRAGWPYVDRARPPGSMALWRSVVESPKWHL